MRRNTRKAARRRAPIRLASPLERFATEELRAELLRRRAAEEAVVAELTAEGERLAAQQAALGERIERHWREHERDLRGDLLER
jgi:hypothetical protein